MDNLQFIIEKQKEFQLKLNNDIENMSDFDKSQFIKNQLMFAVAESVECASELRWYKPWKNYDNWSQEKTEKQKQLAQEEWLDTLLFVINAGIALDIDSNKALELYKEKRELNIRRQEDSSLGYIK